MAGVSKWERKGERERGRESVGREIGAHWSRGVQEVMVYAAIHMYNIPCACACRDQASTWC